MPGPDVEELIDSGADAGKSGNKRADVIAAAQAFARASTPHDELFIVNFNEQVWLGLPPAISLTSDAGVLVSALSNTRAHGQTALYDARVTRSTV